MAEADLLDDTPVPVYPPPDPGAGPAAPAPSATARTAEQGNAIIQQYGTSSDPSSVQAWVEGRMSDAEFTDLQKRRGGSTNNRNFDSNDPNYYNQSTNQLTPFGQAASRGIAASQAGQPVQGAGRFGFNSNAPGDQFSDPYTKLLEGIAKQQLDSLQQPQSDPALDKLLSFLDQRFTEMSGAPGYSNPELAMLRTQALEPIEQDRAASQRRVLERTAARGMLPSSGLTELDSQEQDVAYDRIRGGAERDLGINALNRRQQDLAQALTLGQLSGVTIPAQQRAEDQNRRNESLSLASLLYDLPGRALQENLSVLNGSPGPQDLFSQAVQLMNSNQNQQLINNQRNDAFWGQIGATLADLFK